jgi:hypothetical protein
MYWTGATLPQDPREDYGFVQGIDRRTSLDEFLLPSGGTSNSGKIAMVDSSGEWNLRTPNDIWVTINTNQEIEGIKQFNSHTNFSDGVTILNEGAIEAGQFVNTAIPSSAGRNNYVLLGGGSYMALSAITPADVWVNESGDTMTGSLVFRPSGQLSNTIALVASNGNITCMGNVTAAGSMYSSDKRLKENIKFITLIRPVIDVPVHLFVSFADDVVQRFYLIEIKEGLADASESAIFILPEQLI